MSENNTEIQEITTKINKLRELIQNHAISIGSEFKYKFDDIVSDEFDITANSSQQSTGQSTGQSEKSSHQIITDILSQQTQTETEEGTEISADTETVTTEQNSYTIDTMSTLNIAPDVTQFLETETGETITASSTGSLSYQRNPRNKIFKKYLVKK